MSFSALVRFGDLLLQHVEGGGVLVVGELLGDVDPLLHHDQPDRVAHLREHLDPALELGRPQVARESLVVAAWVSALGERQCGDSRTIHARDSELDIPRLRVIADLGMNKKIMTVSG